MRDWQAIQNQRYDLVVIGGGINGAGVARDAALRGLKTLLLEKGDFCGGSTSWSTRLIHGGLRYLEYFEFKLVRESLQEREILLRLAPHLVQPIQMTIPIYAHNSRSYWEIQAGMLLYDILSFDKSLPNHRMLSSEKVQQVFRDLNPEGLTGAAQYFDGQVVYAERLCLETILSAQAAGATVMNYAKVTGLSSQDQRLTQLTGEDQLTGETFAIANLENAMVLNTSGPWVDQVLGYGPEHLSQQPKIGPTKGSHIIVDPFVGAPDAVIYVEAQADNRPIFIVPWANQYLIGTTDVRYANDLDRIKASNQEIDYLLSEVNRLFPCAQLTRQDVRFTYSGLRPLPYSEGKKTSSISRDHIFYDHQSDGVQNLVSLIGGKLTTYRQVGELLTNLVYRKLGKTAPSCLTRQQPLPGAVQLHDPLIQETITRYQPQLSRATTYHLFKMYGRRALDVLALVDQNPGLAEPVIPQGLDIKAEIVYAVTVEYAQTLVDICRRRTTLAMSANYGFDALPTVTQVLQEYCGWNVAQSEQQVADYRNYIETNCLPDYMMATAAA